MARSMIIIGAGVAGLSAGIYARSSGYDTRIFEMHNQPGGMCTSWTRKGYTFDYCIHNLAGTGKSSGLRQLWDELGALNRMEIIDHEEFVRVEGPGGRSFTMYSELDRTVTELERNSPQDRELIANYARNARKFAHMDIFGTAMGRVRALRLLPHLRLMSRMAKRTMEEEAIGFSDPFMKKAFPLLQYGFSNIPMIVHYIFQGGLDKGDLGSIKGGSLKFGENLANNYVLLGGKIEYGRKVVRILVTDGKAIGVKLDDGTEHFADVIVSAMDGRSTIYELLGGQYKNELQNDYYTAGWWWKEMEMGMSVYLGVRRDLAKEPHALALILETPIKIGGKELDHLDIELFSSVTSLAPPGKGVVKVNLSCNYDHWRQLKEAGPSYQSEKQEISDIVIKALGARFPGLADQVEVSDMTTLVTCERYTGCFHGLQPWGAKREQGRIMKKGLSRTLPGLDRFYMVGQWAEASFGVTTAALSGRRMVKRLCNEDGVHFITPDWTKVSSESRS